MFFMSHRNLLKSSEDRNGRRCEIVVSFFGWSQNWVLILTKCFHFKGNIGFREIQFFFIFL